MNLTLAEYAAAKRLDRDRLITWGVRDQSDARGRYVRIAYCAENGEELAVRQRFALDGMNRFRWRSGAKPCLYGLDRLALARTAGYVVLVEGESDCHTLWQHDIPAVGLPGAGLWREARDAAHLKDIATIYVVAEDDQGGQTMLDWLATSSIRHRARVMRFAMPAKDPSALYLGDPEGFADAFAAKRDEAEPWSVVEAARAGADEREAYETAREVAQRDDILAAFREGLTAAGLVGEDRNASVLYLALTSRLLKKPVSVAYKGPSSGGKSYAVERVLAHFPKSAVVPITSMSEKALIFIDDDLAHKHLIIAEADGAAGEFQDYLVRTLLSEGRLEHRMAEKTDQGIVGRHIVKEGPTGLIITTTRVRLHPENETRLISLCANDTREQTRQVLRAIARRDLTSGGIAPSWPALQVWLSFGERRVDVPYAEALATLVADDAVRMRRDFGAVLSLVEAHALLHRATRERDGDGRIVATLADYAAVRALVVDLVAEGITAKVAPQVRETVCVVADLGGDTHAVKGHAIAQRLRLDKTSANRRCATARHLGYLVNEEVTRGREARWRLGEPMPADKQVLPPVELLARAVGSGAHRGEGVVDPLRFACAGAPPRRSDASETEEVDTPLPSHWRDLFQERAAALEFEGGLARAAAEQQALVECLQRFTNGHAS